jgi:hypothetical protein
MKTPKMTRRKLKNPKLQKEQNWKSSTFTRSKPRPQTSHQKKITTPKMPKVCKNLKKTKLKTEQKLIIIKLQNPKLTKTKLKAWSSQKINSKGLIE